MPGNHATGTAGVLGSSELNRDTAGLQGTFGWAVQSGAVTFSTGLTFNVAAIATADYKVAGVNGASYAGGTVTLAAQDATNPRVDIIVVTVAGAVSAVAGTPVALTSTGGPVPLAPTAAQLEIARIYVPATGGLLSASSITDRRVSLPGTAVVLTTTGDVMYASAAHTVARLGIGTAGQTLQVSGGVPAWVTVAAAGPDYQAFTGSGTWTKPAGAGANSWTLVRIWAAGGGGTGGGRGAAGVDYRQGGGAGSGGALNEAWFLTSVLAATVTVTIAAGGTSGAGSSTDGGVNVAGGVGGNTTFGSFLATYGGGRCSVITNPGIPASTTPGRTGGGGGTASAGQDGAVTVGGGFPRFTTGTTFQSALGGAGGSGSSSTPGATLGTTGCAEFGGAAGGFASNSQSLELGSSGSSSMFGGAGGGGGAAINSSNAAIASSAGGASNSYVQGGGGAAGASSTTGSAGTAGVTGVGTGYGGAGGGGGGAGTAGVGGAGGAGGAAGGAGGGGGAGTSANGGAGGVGGVGYAQVITFI